jgi:cytochrome c-type biogenesis protein CcmH
MRLRVLLTALFLAATLAHADPVPMSGPQLTPGQAPLSDPVFEARLRRLESGLRCLVCQNETLADSGAGLAEDLRREVRSLALAGKSDDDIRAYLHQRYGDFIFYRPPVTPETWVLWFGPFVLLIGLACFLIWRRRRLQRVVPPPVDPQRMRRIEALLIEPDER